MTDSRDTPELPSPEQHLMALSSEEINILLNALAEKMVNTRTYSAFSDADAEPQDTDLCCEAHRQRFERQRDTAQAMKAGYDAMDTLSQKLSDPEMVIEVPVTSAVLVYSSESNELLEQPAEDLVESGTLIDPETGDDLMLHSVRLRRSH